ncbi:ABC transporter ATP-binding protein [Actinomadura fulvescens]|uniref:ABC transporter domain-containing protein n=1 Tax=Actinomadura fulvescens TaxID=46160 RepID=A0ABN3PKJ0_9ACTN
MDPALWWVFGAVGAVIAATVVAALVDLARHDVRYLPKPVWAAIIVLVSYPTGLILYFVLGRLPGAPVPTADQAERDMAERAAGREPISVLGAPLPLTAPAAPAAPDDGRTVLVTEGLGKTFGDTVALDGVDLVVTKGSSYGLIGPNGAGKTTLLYVLTGLRKPTLGSVRLAVPRHRIGFLVDTPRFEPWLTAGEVVDLARHLTGPDIPEGAVASALDQVGLAAEADRRAGSFSRGMLQRLGLATCLVGDPEVLILDEPAAALDPVGRRAVLDLIGRLAQTKTVLLSTHILADVQEVCDTVGVIDKGRLRYQGPLADLLAHTRSACLLHVRPPCTALVESLRRASWLTEVAEHGPGRLRLVVSDAERAEREIPALVAEHGNSLMLFQPATDLETAFLELVS